MNQDVQNFPSEAELSLLPRPVCLQQAILLSLSYLDALGIAPTAYEVWRCLPKWQASYGEVYRLLQTDPLLKTVTHRDRGHLSLRNLEHIEQRIQRGKVSEFKWRRARSTAALLSLVPFVTSISVANTVSMGVAKPTSDVDLLITVQPGRMWTARMLVTGVVFGFGRFRRKSHVANRMCLSFYLADDALNLQPLALAGDDPYLAHWIASLGPVWERRGWSLGHALALANPWTQALMPNLAPQRPSDRRRVPAAVDSTTQPLRLLAEKILGGPRGDRLEVRLRTRQLHRMQKTAPTELRTPTQHIVISDSVLKFHEQDRRTWFRERTIATYRRLLAGELPQLSNEQPELSTAGLVIQPVGATVS
ncbi:MAG: hypothetical protein U0514_00220 [Candidatus Andersenbacteria bacterium]